MSYEVIVNNIDQSEWEECAKSFADYSIYQTWPYQQVRGAIGRQEVDRVLIKDNNDRVVTMCQIRIECIKPFGFRIGYVQWGPLIRGKDADIECPVEALKEVCEAYVGKRVNVLRFVPNVHNDGTGQDFIQMLEQSGFQYAHTTKPYHTMLIPLKCSEELLRKKLHQSWRRKLKKAESAGIETREGSDESLFAILEKFYVEMLQRKDLKGLDTQEFIRTQSMLSDAEKMTIIVAYYNEEPIAAHLTASLGDTAILLLTASNEEGLRMKAPYLVWWKAILASRRLGMRVYDVGGVDFQEVPTVSRFKAGMGGEDCFHIGAFDACSGPIVRIIWHGINKVYRMYRDR